MSTRTQIEFYDVWNEEDSHDAIVDSGPGARLYHHSDGYPSFMLDKIQKFLDFARGVVMGDSISWWDSERVASVFVAYSMGNYEKPDNNPDNREGYGKGISYFQPSQNIHGDIEYLYRIFLKHNDAFTDKPSIPTYDIEILRPTYGGEKSWDIAGFEPHLAIPESLMDDVVKAYQNDDADPKQIVDGYNAAKADIETAEAEAKAQDSVGRPADCDHANTEDGVCLSCGELQNGD